MTNPALNSANFVACSATLALAVGLAGANGAAAGEAEAKALLKGMSDYLAAHKTISFSYDTSFEVVSKDKQKLQVAASGNINMSRPKKLRASRSGYFANVEMVFDGKNVHDPGQGF